jgi:ribose/xylose/arabinose/galactoside ABC-type transport system permease subunit
MFNLEDKLAPAHRHGSLLADVLVMALLLAAAAALHRQWASDMSDAAAMAREARRDDDTLAAADAESEMAQLSVQLVSRMFSPVLLAALGFALALRCGVIDLSVWLVAGVGSLTAATLIRAGVMPQWAFAAAVGAGAAVGLCNGLLIGLLRWPGPAVTLGVAVCGWFALRMLHCPEELTIDGFAFEAWTTRLDVPLRSLRMGIVLAPAGLVGAVLMFGRIEGLDSRTGRGVLVAAMIAAGALAGLSGATGLLDTSRAFRPRVIEDLRIPAAALLAGAALLGGPGRTLLVGLLLPLAVLVTGQWAVWVMDYRVGGYLLQTGLLVAMTIGAHAAIAAILRTRGPCRIGSAAGLVLCLAGMVLATLSGGMQYSHGVSLGLLVGAVNTWAAGLVTALVCRYVQRRAWHLADGGLPT